MRAVQPALSRKEWERRCVYRGGLAIRMSSPEGRAILIQDDAAGRPFEVSGPELHALAAACLFSQPFGFSREDVELLEMFGRGDPQQHIRDECNSLAARIAALLPPEDAA